ncbi:MAG TPA: hypothetical protein VGI39_26755 [Polyangiaceae bacterium]|jgi:hypothetical protein
MGRVLDLAMGLCFVYLLLASIVSAVSEIMAWLVGRRAHCLRDAISEMLGDDMMARLYDHSLLKNLSPGKLPSYIPSRLFAAALLHQLGDGANATNDALAVVRANVAEMKGSGKAALQALLDEGVKTIEEARQAVAHWFDASMDRVSGTYKRRSHLIAMGLAVLVTVVFNADSVRISQALWADPALRAEIVREAAASMPSANSPAAHSASPQEGDPPPDFARSSLEVRRLAEEVGGLGMPVGWANWHFPRGAGDAVEWLLGLFATAFAVGFGAPFWFEVLNRLANVRSVGPKPSKAA